MIWDGISMRKLIVTRYKGGIAAALFDGSKAVELFYENEEESLLGNIYVGKVADVVPNIRAAFVEIEGRVPCYYSLAENTSPVCVSRGQSKKLAQGDEILVQVSRESVKSKAPTVTSNLSLTGRFLVLTTGKKQIGISAKIAKELRPQLLAAISPFQDARYGWIVRTNAAYAPAGELEREAGILAGRYEDLIAAAPHRTCRSCLYKNPPAWLLQIRDIYDTEYEQIVTDDEALYGELQTYLREYLPAGTDALVLYRDRLLPLDKLYPLEGAFREALSERVWLRSGAYLVIQPTEALTAIDVNTGKCDRGKAGDVFYKINLEAAREIARQIRLRNLSGIIVADFINMENGEQDQDLLDALAQELKKDPVKAVVVDMTPLGLVEITRKRVRKSLAEKMKGAKET